MAHNGGKLQVNFWFPTIARDYPFCNLMKTARQDWYPSDNTTLIDPSKLDANGYHHTMQATGFYTWVNIPTILERPGQYVLKWTGTGTVNIGGVVSGGNKTATDGRYVLTIANDTTTEVTIGINGVGTPGSDYPHNIIICHVDDEALVDADPYAFSPYFLAKLIDAKIGCLRFLDWTLCNNGNLTRWADRKPLGYHSYTSKQYGTAAVPTTTNTGDAYDVTVAGFTLTDKVQIHVKWNATSTGLKPTISVNGGADIQIADATYFVLTNTSKPTANRQDTLTYDADLNLWLYDYTLGQGIRNGLPYELMVKLCNEVGAHPWFPIPVYCLDPHTDLISGLIDYCKNNLDDGLIPIFEPANEVWNTIFFATRYADAKTAARAYNYRGPWVSGTSYLVGDAVSSNYNVYRCILDDPASGATHEPGIGGSAGTYWSLTSGYLEWYGRMVSKLGQALDTAYAGDRTKYMCICSYYSEYSQIAAQAARLTCPAYVAETSSANAAYNWATHVCHAMYVAVDYDGVFYPAQAAQETAWADEYATATTARKEEILDLYFVDTNNATELLSPWRYRFSAMTAFDNLANSYGLGSIGYEGGYTGNWDVGTSNVVAFRLAARHHPGMIHWSHKLWAHWESLGGIFYPSYVLSGDNIWAIFYPTIYATPSAQWDAMTMWNNGQRRFRLTAA